VPFLNIEALEATPLVRSPFDYLIAPGFVGADHQAAISQDYPDIRRPGAFELGDLELRGAVAALVEELDGAAFREAVEAKFAVDLAALPTVFTLRGVCGPNDGRIHTDLKSKIITVLIYLNPTWSEDGGRLRLLRNGKDIEAVVAETPPDFGTLLVFRRADNSWHGHKPFLGPRRVLQMNWVVSEQVAGWHRLNVRLRAAAGRLLRPNGPPGLRRPEAAG
jgi:hypothetical protein